MCLDHLFKMGVRGRWEFRREEGIQLSSRTSFRKDVACHGYDTVSNHIYPTPPLGQDMTQGQFFKWSLTGLNSEFSFS